jgi:hypothetical protein
MLWFELDVKGLGRNAVYKKSLDGEWTLEHNKKGKSSPIQYQNTKHHQTVRNRANYVIKFTSVGSRRRTLFKSIDIAV